MGHEIDFLPVGDGEKSGDAICLRFGDLRGSNRDDQVVVVVDGGFKDSGEQLVGHVREYYGTDRVDIVVSTHPDADHASGLEVVLEKLKVGVLWMHKPWDHTDDIAKMFKDGRVSDESVEKALRKSLDNARSLERLASSKGIPVVEPFTGLADDSGCLRVIGPTETFYESLLPGFRGFLEPKAEAGVLEKMREFGGAVVSKILESWNIETLDDSGETGAENNTSAVLMLSVDGRHSLLTGDAGIPALTEVADQLDAVGFDFGALKFIQVPHHGSKRNVGPTILNRLVGPKLKEQDKLKIAFVSASRDGAPKHPARKVANAFLRRGAPVHSTQGSKKSHSHDAPERGWTSSVPLPLYEEVDE